MVMLLWRVCIIYYWSLICLHFAAGGSAETTWYCKQGTRSTDRHLFRRKKSARRRRGKSKTEAKGEWVPLVPYCSITWCCLPACLVFDWQEASNTIQELLLEKKSSAGRKGQKAWETHHVATASLTRDSSFMFSRPGAWHRSCFCNSSLCTANV